MTDSAAAPSPFVHLRLHTAYSLSEGAIRIATLPDLCATNRMPALAITDTNNLFGALEFAETMIDAGIQPIIGCSLDLLWPLEQEATGRIGAPHVPQRRDRNLPALALLAQSEPGYRNLMALTTAAYRRGREDNLTHISLEDLRRHGEGLIALTGGREGPVDTLLMRNMGDRARDLVAELAPIFPDRLYVELQRHGDEVSELTLPHLVAFAYELGLPLVATNQPYFTEPALARAHDALLCISQGVVVAEQQRRRVTPEHYFKSSSDMQALFADLPEAFYNTLEIARRCAFAPRRHAPILPKFETPSGLSEQDELRRLSHAGLTHRLANGETYAEEEEYRARLDFELDVINRMQFPGYFLIVADFIQWAKRQGIPVGPGRGSGAGSVVAWALTITDLDPLRFNLLFERFLNPERVSMPDFDIDFCQERRDEVIRYVQNKYGADRVAQIITFGKLQARAVVRDVGRVLQMPYGQVDRICKLIPNNPASPVSLQQAIDGEPELQDIIRRDETAARLMEIALRLEGLYRHASTHAAGVVIGDRPLEEIVPLYFDPRSSMPATQFNLKWVEPAGLVKFDFLGLKTLSVIAHAIAEARAHGAEIDLERLPLDDAATYQLLARGDAVGVFQFEGSGMRDLLRQAEPSNLEDLIALVALYRPGPMQEIPKYIACKHGHEQPEALHPLLQDIATETYGVVVYQEQVMQIAQVLSGFTLGEADILRRAMGKKDKAEMDQQRDRFMSGALENGVSRAQASHIFDLIAKFAGYAFNKSHSAGYALVAYQTAYLKANHPVEFYAASMSFDRNNTDKLNLFRNDAADRGIELLPPDVNLSDANFSSRDGKVVYALAAIKNVGEQAMRHVVAVRDEGGVFKDVFDFAERVDPRFVNKRAFENLIRAGAFDSLHRNRAQLVASVDTLLSYGANAAAERESAQVSLFGENLTELPRPPLADVDDWKPEDRLQHELEAIGFYLSGHPLDGYERTLAKRKVVKWQDTRNGKDGESKIVNLAGVVLQAQHRRSRRSDLPMAFVMLSDPTGAFEVTVLSDLLRTHGEAFQPGQKIVVTAIAKWEASGLRLEAKSVRTLEEVVASDLVGYRVYVDTPESIDGVKQTLAALPARPHHAPEPRGVIRIVLTLDDADREVEMAVPGRYPAEPALRGALKAVSGVREVIEL